MPVPIDLRFSNVDPPLPDPPKTIYGDLVNLPDPVKLSLTVRVFNYDDVGLYMRVDAYKAGWTFSSYDLGLLGSGANMYYSMDRIGQRAKPASATFETITVRLRAYTDAGYTTLKWTFERVIDVVYLNTADGSWTQDMLNNFDDGTVQGWSYTFEYGCSLGTGWFKAWTDYVLSPAYSLNLKCVPSGDPTGYSIWKSVTTPDRENVFAIFDIRLARSNIGGGEVYGYLKRMEIRKDSDVLLMVGRIHDDLSVDYVPNHRWIRVIVKLPRNTTFNIKAFIDGHRVTGWFAYIWLDDFKIISKDTPLP